MGIGTERSARTAGVLGALLCSAVLFYFGTGLSPIAVLTWIAPIPVLVLATRAGGWTAAGVAFGAFLLGTANVWGYQSHSGDEPLWPFGIIMDVGMSLLFTFAVWVFWALVRRRRALLATLAAPAAWTGAVYLVTVVNPMGMMGSLANDQGDAPVVLQTASWAGMWGVEFLVLLPACAIAALCAPDVARAARIRAGAVAAVVLALALGGGALRLASGGGTGAPQRLAAITQNAGYHWGPDVGGQEGRELVAAYVREITSLPDGVRLVVLPEAAFSAEQEWPAELVGPMRQAAKARGLSIVLGFEYYDRKGKHNYDYALAFPADGAAPARYLKHHDMVSPPGRELGFVPGAEVSTAMVICGDANFANPIRDSAAAGARLLAIPAELAVPPGNNDEGGWQHSRNSLVRGVENGLPVVFSDANGSLMVSDGFGRVTGEARTGGTAPFTTVTAEVPTGPGATLYTRLGDWSAWLCLAITLAGLVFAHPKTLSRRSGGDRAVTG
ncbi:nitrilase-related carbon-nitrogen hydrolase [Amycolatopsis sp. CA-230715]|uniref:nitrilase-related carbon-nitrogen hydrolase n=1 Tax=Amycolatopsis sp. CA-230715 TaxID=2745196 RepID=UPI001C0390C3|nr:nitrilase-related carbon-nitrogen hydrolase [Amycolatopsis sp. CA-230715]QWF78062.1 Apolipoprotein N-acyltransferase [Amycolatopsis sp. CA-230715]